MPVAQLIGVDAGLGEETDADPRSPITDLREEYGRDRRRHRVVAAHRERPLQRGEVELARGREQALRLLDENVNLGTHRDGVRRGRHGPARAHEDLVARRATQPPKSAAHRRHGQVQPVGRAGDVALFKKSIERDEQIQIELHGSKSTLVRAVIVDKLRGAQGVRMPNIASPPITDTELVCDVARVLEAAGARLRERFAASAPPTDLDGIAAAIDANDAASLEVLRAPLMALRPDAGWVEDEQEGGALPAGEWWIVDPAEGNINHVQGMPDWGVTATLIRDGDTVLTAVHLPMAGHTLTATRGEGAWLDGTPIRVSAKRELAAAIVGTGQARPGEDAETHAKLGRSVTAMLDRALVVQTFVPATLPLVKVACGEMDAFWQYSQVRSGLVAGALLVQEGGGIVTDTHGDPWTLTSGDFLASAPGIHPAAVHALSAPTTAGAS